MNSLVKKIIHVARWYGFWGSMRLCLDVIHTKLFYPQARLVRRPCRIRSLRCVRFNSGFTSGVDLRIDIFGEGVLQVGRNVEVNDSVHIGVARNITIGDETLIASRVFITDHDHGEYSSFASSAAELPPSERGLSVAPVRIGRRVWIGEGVCILKGVTIGDGAIIGAGAIVNKDVPGGCIAAGVPARVIKQYCSHSGKWIQP